MAYLGRQPIIGNYQVLDAITASATVTYALTKNSVAVFPQTPANCIVSLNGVIQAPFDSYTISGSNIVFASALTGSDSIDFITVLGDVLNVGTVSDGTITDAKTAFTAPTITRLTSGTGTYTLPSGVKYIIVEMAGAGGGGSGGGTGSWGAGSNGGNTTFGTVALGNGGTGGSTPWSGAGGTGGSVTLGAGGTQIYNSVGGRGGGSSVFPDIYSFGLTGMGGQNPLGGGAPSVTYIGGGLTGITNSGGGGSGGGGGTSNAAYTGTGGGAGGYMKFLISSPSASYAYAVGAGGAGGSAGTGSNAQAGGAGGSGVIIIQEFYV